LGDFDELFEEIDEDDNGYLTRNEMAIFIKKAFKNPLSPKAGDQKVI
jgi:Ca2+-binding EF-hand superfamily protein